MASQPEQSATRVRRRRLQLNLSGSATLILVVFIALKLAGVISWSWWWVLAPLWIQLVPLALLVAGFLTLLAGASLPLYVRRLWLRTQLRLGRPPRSWPTLSPEEAARWVQDRQSAADVTWKRDS